MKLHIKYLIGSALVISLLYVGVSYFKIYAYDSYDSDDETVVESYVAPNEYVDPAELRLAIEHNRIDEVEDLLTKMNRNAINDQDAFNCSPLHYAVYYNRPAIVRLFLNAGANSNDQDENGDTILQIAVDLNYLEIAQELINAGADIDTRNNEGRSLRSFAATQEMRDLLDRNRNRSNHK